MAERAEIYAEIYEVGPRDGLQNEAAMIATSDKIKLVDMLSNCGLAHIEVTSFVSPKWVPQMADAADVMAGIARKSGVTYAALAPNMRGLDAALAAHADEVAIFASASEGFSRANINASIKESLTRFAPVAKAALAGQTKLRGYVSCITDCPYDGPTSPEAVAEVTKALLAMGCYEVSLGDTIGAATPASTKAMLKAVLEVAQPSQLAGHFHDTHGRALDNIDVCLAQGMRRFDAAVGGLGGCPYAPGAAGNVASEAVEAHLSAQGFETGIDAEALAQASAFARSLRGAD